MGRTPPEMEALVGANSVETGLRALSDSVQEPSTKPTPGGGQARWAPTLADFLFLSLIVWLFLAGPNGWAALLSDGDTGWHIRVGDWIREHRTFPQTDFLSFSKAGEAWFAWEWAAEVAMSWLHSIAGLKGVVLGLGLLLPGYLLVLFRHAIWRGATPLIALPILLMACGSSAIHYLARPHLFTLLFLAVSLWLVEVDRRTPGKRIWLLVPLSLVWANLHGGFLSLVACLGLVAAGEALARNWPMARRYGALAVACLSVSLVNPYGYQLHVHILAYLRSDWIKEAVDEFQSPSFRSEAMLLFEVLLFASLISVYRCVRRGNWADALLVVGWAHLGLSSVRHVPIFLLVAVPILGEELSSWWREIVPALPKRAVLRTFDQLSSDLQSGFARSSVWMFAPILALMVTGKPIVWPDIFPEARFPVSLIDRHRSEIEGKRVLTTDEWGDYLAYRYFPQQRVFFDGRSDFYGEELGRIYLKIMRGGPEAEKEVERFQFDTVLVPPEWQVQIGLRRSGRWDVLVDSEKAVLLRRRVGQLGKKF